jgi:hypothetical protein
MTVLERDDTSSRSRFLFARDLRANASRLSRGKSATHFSGSCASGEKSIINQGPSLAPKALQVRAAHHRTSVSNVVLLARAVREAQIKLTEPLQSRPMLELKNSNAARPCRDSWLCQIRY